ncbi:MAG: DUF4340 domain-containing protein [Isosphaeraceae bacterium]
MNERNKTLAFVAVALALMATAVVATMPRGGTSAAFFDQGESFFPKFTDPTTATSLEVIDFDESTAEARVFKVMLKNGQWVIPSHHDYPADAKDRLARTAAGVIDLSKDVIVSDSPDQYEAFGVIDPLDKKATSLKGRGKRVTLKDKSGEVLADFLIGKEVPGRSGQRYVRVPDMNQKRVYAVNVNVDLSTRFADWIETNLLKLETDAMRKVVFDNHKVDPEQGTVQRGDVFSIERKDSAAPWTMDGLNDDQEVNPDKVSALSTALGDLKIVGVRTKPDSLKQALKAAATKGISLSGEARVSLQDRGFYLTRNGQLLSNQGDVIVMTDAGVVYTLRFGEVTFASGDALSAGLEDSAASKSSNEEEKKPDTVESRYLFVTATFEPDLVPNPPVKADDSGELPSDPFQRTPEERVAKEKEEKEQAEKARISHDQKVTEGKKKAEELTNRFADWYYVVPGDAFRSIELDRAALTRTKGETPAAPPAGFGPGGGLPPGFPGGGFPGGLPPGHP